MFYGRSFNSFIDLTATEKGEMFSKILDTDLWDNAYQHVLSDLKEIDTALISSEGAMKTLEDLYNDKENEIETFKKKLDEFMFVDLTKKRQELKDVEQRMDTITEEMDIDVFELYLKYTEYLSNLAKKQLTKEEEVEDIKKNAMELGEDKSKEIASVKSQYNRFVDEKNRYNSKRMMFTNQIREKKDMLKKSICPTCKRPFDNMSEKHMPKIQETLKQLEHDKNTVSQKVKKLDAETKKLNDTLEDF